MSTDDVHEEGGTATDDYVARFCERDGHIVECTIFPGSIDEGDLTTTWITASTGSFVDLATVR